MARKLETPAEFREKLRKSVIESGKWIAENADKLIPEVDLLSEFSIEIVHDNFERMPVIRTSMQHICPEAAKVFMAKDEEDGKR